MQSAEHQDPNFLELHDFGAETAHRPEIRIDLTHTPAGEIIAAYRYAYAIARGHKAAPGLDMAAADDLVIALDKAVDQLPETNTDLAREFFKRSVESPVPKDRESAARSIHTLARSDPELATDLWEKLLRDASERVRDAAAELLDFGSGLHAAAVSASKFGVSVADGYRLASAYLKASHGEDLYDFERESFRGLRVEFTDDSGSVPG